MPQRFRARLAAELLLVVFLAFCLACGGGSSQNAGRVDPKALKQIVLNPQNPSLLKGNVLQMTATGIANDGTRSDITNSVVWKSTQPGVAAISVTGALTAAGVGSAQATAQLQGVTGGTSVTVSPAVVVSIAVTPDQSSLPVGESEQLSASGTFTDGTVQDLTQSATWTSSGDAIAGVNATGATIANGVGTATINASYSNLTGVALVTVTPAAPLSLNIVPSSLSMPLGSSRQLQAIATFSNGSTQDMTGLVQWNSSQPNIANISNGGLLVAQQTGASTISATGNSLTATADASVTPLLTVNYFDLAAAQKSGVDGSIRLTNPGLSGDNLCAMIYVFDQSQELSECCGCSITDSGLRTLSLVNDLTANPLTGQKLQNGVIKIVPSDAASNPSCNPESLTPSGVVLGWGSNAQVLSDKTFQVTETKFSLATLSDGESNDLAAQCTFLHQLGSGQGICACGTGD